MIESLFEAIPGLLNIDSLWSLVKLFYLFAIAIYLVFAVLMLKQVREMTQTVAGLMNLPLFILVLVHLLAVFGIFFFALSL